MISDQPGKITELNIPGGHGVRVDTHVYKGYTIPSNYDSMIAKLITTAQTREEAIAKMKRALEEFYIEGIKTTIPFHRQLMENPDYLAGNYTTKFMEDFVMDKNLKTSCKSKKNLIIKVVLQKTTFFVINNSS
jgi:acetyl-CoA carboxylase biotin carboxylase subunit